MRLNRARITSVTDALHFARKRLPPGVMQQFESGAGLLQTHDANVHAFESVMFRPRHGVYVPERDQSTTVLGHRLRTPFMQRQSVSWRRECGLGILASHGDWRCRGIQFVSAVCSSTIEDVMAAARGQSIFSYYFSGRREGMEVTIERVKTPAQPDSSSPSTP